MRRMVVKNIQQYPVGRGGFVFRPGQETEVQVSTRQQHREIKACVYLKVLADEEVTSPELPKNATKGAELVDPELYRWITEKFDIPSKQALALWEADFTDEDAFADADKESIIAVPGVGESSWQKIEMVRQAHDAELAEAGDDE